MAFLDAWIIQDPQATVHELPSDTFPATTGGNSQMVDVTASAIYLTLPETSGTRSTKKATKNEQKEYFKQIPY